MRTIFPYIEMSTATDETRPISLFTCPSDPRGNIEFLSGGGFASPFGLTWYVPLDKNGYGDDMGVIVSNYYYGNPDTGTQNLTPRTFRIMDVSDGTATTAMLAERTPSIGYGPPSNLSNSSYEWPDLYWGWWDYPTGPDTRTPIRASTSGGLVDGLSNVVAEGLFFTSSRSGGPNCSNPAVAQPGSTTDQCSFNSVTSFHTGGVLFLFADGSVHFLTYGGINAPLPNTTTTLGTALSTRAQGEPIPGDQVN